VEKIREIAQNVEAQIIKVPTGCQDYYPAMYGGVSAIDLTPAGIQHNALPVDLDDFNNRIVLAYSGKPRNSGINNWEVTKAHIDGDKTVFKNIERIASIAHALRTALVKPDWDEAARLIREEWAHRRKNAPGITTEFIDTLIAAAKRAGGKAAKVCGAGGGGCVFFLVEPGAKAAVQEAIRKEGAEILDVTVAPKGVRVKVSR
jgi:D-glycero-alpha-D-manno-heptose-7-phosphate kinase